MVKSNIKIIPNGIITSLSKSQDGGYDYFCEGGVLCENGEFVEESQQLRYNDYGTGKYKAWNIAPTNINSNDIETKNYDICYCGIIHGAFGHLLTETISRLYYVVGSNPAIKCAFLTQGGYVPFQFYEFLELLDIAKERIEFIDKPTQYKNVIVPTTSFTLHKEIKDDFLVVIDKMLSNIPYKQNIDKLFLSSGGFQQRRLNEKVIEQIFNKNGYKSFQPEQMSLKEQISYIKSAKELVTTEGTSSHMSLFLNKNAQLVVLKRQTEYNISQLEIDKIKGYKVDYVNVFIPFLKIKSLQSPQILGITNDLLSYLQNRNFKDLTQKSHISPFVITQYINEMYNFAKSLNLPITNSDLKDLKLKNIRYVKFQKFIKILFYKIVYEKFHLLTNKYKRYFDNNIIIYI